MWHGGLRHLLVGHEGSARDGVTKPGHQDGGQNGRFDPCVVVRVDADIFLLGVEGVFAAGLGFQLVMGLEVGPPPNAAVDHVGQTFTMRNLKVDNPSNDTSATRYPLVAIQPLEYAVVL